MELKFGAVAAHERLRQQPNHRVFVLDIFFDDCCNCTRLGKELWWNRSSFNISSALFFAKATTLTLPAPALDL